MVNFKAVMVVLTALFAFSNVYAENSLRSVSIVFRHGHRTILQPYPKDPLKGKTSLPYGLGQLTNEGKVRAYSLGKNLRERYKDLLGTDYKPGLVKAVTTNTDRTKSSLQLVLTGLFPPNGTNLEWNPSLNWQPIPFDQLQSDSNVLLHIPWTVCPKFIKLYTEYMNSTEGLKVDEKYSGYFKYVADNSGVQVNTVIDMYDIYNILSIEQELKYDIPRWTQKVYPRPLHDSAIDFFLTSTATPQLRQLAGGFLLKKIINDSLKKTRPKMFVYSGHEFNIVHLLSAMEVFYPPHVPEYGACVMVELHAINGTYGFKIFYEDHSGTPPKQLVVPGCKEFCEAKAFIGLVGKNIPDDYNSCRL